MVWAAIDAATERDGFHTTVNDGERVVSFSDTLDDGTWDAYSHAIEKLREEKVMRVDIWAREEAGLVQALRGAGFEVWWTRVEA